MAVRENGPPLRDEPATIPVPTRVLREMVKTPDDQFRVLLWLIYHERVTPGWQVLVTVGQVAKGAGLVPARARMALDGLAERSVFVTRWPRGKFSLAVPVLPESERGAIGGEASSATEASGAVCRS